MVKAKTDKISIIGAGTVGSHTAYKIATLQLSKKLVLVDIDKNLCLSRAADISDACAVHDIKANIIATNNYSEICDSSVVVVTAGFPRKPGMTREELIAKNAGIVKDICQNIKKYCKHAIVIIVTNPLDIMTFLAFRTLEMPREHVIGMSGVLDTARLWNQIWQKTHCLESFTDIFVGGNHGELMFLLTKLNKNHKKAQIITDDIIAATKNRGKEIVDFGFGSAFFGPSEACAYMVENILGNTKKIITASVYLSGEYDLHDLCLGVPVQLSSKGINKIIEVNLSETEQKGLHSAAQYLREQIKFLSSLF